MSEAKTPNGRTTADAIYEAEHLLEETFDRLGPGWFMMRITKIREALADRPSQPPQNVEAGDASSKTAKPSLEELIESARHYKMTPEEREEQARDFAFGNVAIDNPRVTRKMIDEEADKSLKEKAGDAVKAATSSPSAKGTGEQKVEAGEMAAFLKAIDEGADGKLPGWDVRTAVEKFLKQWDARGNEKTNPDFFHDCTQINAACRILLFSEAPAIIAAASNAERLKVAEGVVTELQQLRETVRENREVATYTDHAFVTAIYDVLDRNLSPAPAQMPGDERIKP